MKQPIKKQSVALSTYVLAAVLSAFALNAQAEQAPLTDYEKLLMDEAGSTEMRGSSRAEDADDEPAVAPTTATDPETLAQEVSSSLERLLESGKSPEELKQEMSGVVSEAIGKGVDLNALRSLVDSAMDGAKKDQPDLVSVEEAGATLQSIIEANRRLIEGDPEDDYIKQLNSELTQKVPAVDSSEPKAAVAASTMPSQEAAASTDEAGVADLAGKRTHTVRRGETLSYIAKKYYGSGAAFTKIYQANREKLATPNLVLVGQRLVIPE